MKITIEKKDRKIELSVQNNEDIDRVLEVFIAGLTGIGYEYKDIAKAIVKTGKVYQKYS